MLNGGVRNKQLLPGVPRRKREISYIPSEALNEAIVRKLKPVIMWGFIQTARTLMFLMWGLLYGMGTNCYSGMLHLPAGTKRSLMKIL